MPPCQSGILNEYFMERLVLLHGAVGSADQMIPLREQLSDFFEVHNFEFEGHGSKSSIDNHFSIPNFVIQLDTFIESVADSVHVFGYSMGGFIALVSAARGNKAIKSITTLGTKMSWNTQVAASEIKNLDPEKIREKVPKFFEVLQERHGEHWVDVLSRTADFMKSLGSSNPISKESMSEIKCPVLLLIGNRDQMVTVEETREVYDWMMSATLKVLDDVEHPIEKVDTVLLSRLISDFAS